MNRNDKTQWKCFVGLVDYDDAMNAKVLEESKKFYKHSSVLDASDDWNKLKSKKILILTFMKREAYGKLFALNLKKLLLK